MFLEEILNLCGCRVCELVVEPWMRITLRAYGFHLQVITMIQKNNYRLPVKFTLERGADSPLFGESMSSAWLSYVVYFGKSFVNFCFSKSLLSAMYLRR